MKHTIIEVPCEPCEGKGQQEDFGGPWDCSHCENTGKRRMAAWLPLTPPEHVNTPLCIHEDTPDWLKKQCLENLPIYLKDESPFQSGDTLPSGDILGKVELNQAKYFPQDVIAALLHAEVKASGDIQLWHDTWLCTAFIQNKTEEKRTHRDDGTIIGGKYHGMRDHDVRGWKPE